MRKSDALKALSKAQAEIQLWKSRYETEGMGRVEELEAARGKLQAKIVESEELVDVLTTKVANAEKSKTRMTADLDDISMEYKRVHAAALITEKRGKNFDKVLGEGQSKGADVAPEVAASQDEGRNYTSELFRLKAAQDEAVEQLDIHTIQAEVDAMLQAAKNAEEKSEKAMVDAARLADELRAEQDHAAAQASAKQSLANELAQLEGRLSDAEAAAARGGKAAMAKLESKIRDLEAELANTQARTGESAKAYQRAERKCKELVFSSGEDKKNQDRMSDLAAKLQSKIKTYKQQIEEAEEIAALNLAKFRKAQQELEEAEERAKLASLI